MPYIAEKDRQILDANINSLIMSLKTSIPNMDNPYTTTHIKNEDLLHIIGNINYVVSRICCGIMGEISYSKIALITGVLENIKQEFYRRVASPYENNKIIENGDIKEYKKLT